MSSGTSTPRLRTPRPQNLTPATGHSGASWPRQTAPAQSVRIQDVMPTGVGSYLAGLEKEEGGPDRLGGCPSLPEGLGFKGAQRVVECVEVDHHHATDFAISRSWPHESVHTGRGCTESRAPLEGRCGGLGG